MHLLRRKTTYIYTQKEIHHHLTFIRRKNSVILNFDCRKLKMKKNILLILYDDHMIKSNSVCMYVNKCHVSKQLLVGNFQTDFKSIISFLAKHINFNYRTENWKS